MEDQMTPSKIRRCLITVSPNGDDTGASKPDPVVRTAPELIGPAYRNILM